MAKSPKKLPSLATLLTAQNIVLGGIVWSVFTFCFFSLFSITVPGEDSSLLYLLITYLLETLPFCLAAWLCYRNWKSPQIASGRDVWFFIGLGLAAYTIGNLLFGIWELYFGLDPEISPADLFYIIFSICVGWGMILAVLPRRLNLEPKQWLIIGGIAIFGTILAVAVKYFSNLKPTVEEAAVSLDVPQWLIDLDDFLRIFDIPVNMFYSIADVALLIIGSTLLLAFWGGRFSISWRMIAAAALSKYVADLSLYVALSLPGNYESGGLMDVFYVFCGVLYAIGAALEYDVSTSRPSRGRRRRVAG